jgi:integrase
LPASLSPDGKRKARYFANEKEAKAFCAQLKKGKGLAEIDGTTIANAEAKEHAPLIMAAIEQLGDPTRVFEAIQFFRKVKLNIKGGTLSDVMDAFAEARQGTVSDRRWADNNMRLRKLTRVHGDDQIADITESDLEDFIDDLPGHTLWIHKDMKLFFKWATKKNFIALNPMANVEARERAKSRKDIYTVETFSRMLRIAAGLEAPRAGEEPTKDFLPLLPWFILSGFCGLRSCEAFRKKISDEAIRWSDLLFDRGFIHIRHEVAKRTKRPCDKRNIKTAAYIEAARAWLALVPRESEFVVTSIERILCDLKREFEARTGIIFKANAFRHSFASYALTTDGKEGVGHLALEMGNSETVCKQFYIETLEPRTGVAWFGLRPEGPANLIPMTAAAA